MDIELSVRQDEGKDVRLFVFCGSHQEERRRHNRRQDRVGDDGAALVSVKGSAQLVSDPESADGFRLLVYVPPAKNLAAGLCRLYDVELIDAAGDNVVTDVKLTAQ